MERPPGWGRAFHAAGLTRWSGFNMVEYFYVFICRMMTPGVGNAYQEMSSG